jgi:hypothetical protein
MGKALRGTGEARRQRDDGPALGVRRLPLPSRAEDGPTRPTSSNSKCMPPSRPPAGPPTAPTTPPSWRSTRCGNPEACGRQAAQVGPALGQLSGVSPQPAWAFLRGEFTAMSPRCRPAPRVVPGPGRHARSRHHAPGPERRVRDGRAADPPTVKPPRLRSARVSLGHRPWRLRLARRASPSSPLSLTAVAGIGDQVRLAGGADAPRLRQDTLHAPPGSSAGSGVRPWPGRLAT